MPNLLFELLLNIRQQVAEPASNLLTHKCHLKRARPTGLAHKQKNKTKRHHPHKNTHAKTTKKKITKKQPSLINTLEQNIITNMNNKEKKQIPQTKKNLKPHIKIIRYIYYF